MDENYKGFFADEFCLDGDELATFFLEEKRMEFLQTIVRFVIDRTDGGERKQISFKIKTLFDYDRKNDCKITPSQKRKETEMIRVGSHILKKAESNDIDFIRGIAIKIDENCGKKASKRYIATIMDNSFMHIENPLYIRTRA